MTNLPNLNSVPSSQDAAYARLVTVAPPASYEPRQPVRVLRLPEVINRVGLKRAAIYLYVERGQFTATLAPQGNQAFVERDAFRDDAIITRRQPL